MIEINLIPPEMKKKELPFQAARLSGLNLQNLPVFNIIVGLAAMVVAIQVLLFVVGIIGTTRLNALTAKYNALLPEKNIADTLKAKVDDINKRSAAIDELMARRFDWARKLNSLSDAMTQGIWLSEVSYDERPGGRMRAAPGRAGRAQRQAMTMPGMIVMTGYAASAGDQGTALVGRFIKSLRESDEFFSDFSGIELVSVKSDKVENQEVMSFRINCFFN